MTAADDLIRRQEAINHIQHAMKRIFTAARRQGYKECVEILGELRGTQRIAVTVAEPTVISPGQGHSHWFYAGGHRFCYNCGGEGDIRFVTTFCPHCAFIMDELHDIEIE